MKRLTYTVLFFLLSACASLQSTPVIAPTETQVTSTAIPIKTPPPTKTETPKPTVDPNMPEAPNGEKVQKDAEGYFFTDENNVMYRDTTLTDSLGQERYRGWDASHVVDSSDNLNGGIPLQDPNDGYPAGSPFYFLAQTGVNVPYLHHTPDSSDSGWGKDLSGSIYNNLKDNRFSSVPRHQFAQQFDSLSVPFSFLGKDYSWKLHQGYKFIAIPWDDADPTTHPDFVETPTDKQFDGPYLLNPTAHLLFWGQFKIRQNSPLKNFSSGR